MGYELIVGNYTYSSWSLRGWLMLHRFGIPMTLRRIDFLNGSVAEQVAEIRPARTVPVLIADETTVIWDSLAIAEEMASRHPEAGLWPGDAAARAHARSLSAEMHSSYGALRDQCPMHLQAAYSSFPVSEATQQDIARIEDMWTLCRTRFGAEGPWLFGEYSAVDAMFAPVAMRFATYGLGGEASRDYVAAHLADPALRRWRAMGIARKEHLPWYDRDAPRTDWPGPAPRAARAVDSGTPENAACPYSGSPITSLLEMDGRIFGFCNAFCRDKTVVDPEAWPRFMELMKA